MTSQPHDDRQDTALPDLTGWDAAPQGKDVPWHPELPDPRAAYRNRSLATIIVQYSLFVILVAFFGLIILAMAIPTCGCGVATNETAAVQNLKALATAQAQFIKKKDFYATSGTDLNANGTLIAADLKAAFESWQNNCDSATPAPKAGYIYRMLQGDSRTNLVSYHKNPADPSAGMDTWAVICRPATPGVSGDNQYYITEAGTVYKMADPPKGDPRYGKFLLDCTPAQSQTTWTTAK